MSAGAIQLAAIGQQDAYLTGEPSITYFSGVYRRHTPFSLQAFNIPFQGSQVNWGSQAVCRIPYKGDLVRGATLAVTLPALAPTSTDYVWPVAVGRQKPIPFLYIDGNLDTPIFVNTEGLDNYTVANSDAWLEGGSLAPYVSLDLTASKFVFNCSSVTVNVAETNTIGVFWGLDPQNFTRNPTSNTIQWDVSPGSAHGDYADLSLVQSGWVPPSLAPPINATETLLINTYSTVTLSRIGGTTANRSAFWINMSLFGNQTSETTLIAREPGGTISFTNAGTYLIILALNVSQPVTRIGVGHSPIDGHPSGQWVASSPTIGQWSWNDYIHELVVMPMPITPLVAIPINVVDATQYYFVDVETIGGSMQIAPGSQGTEIAVTDVREYRTVSTNQTLVLSTIDLSQNWTTAATTPTITPIPSTNTFGFSATGIFTMRGVLFSTGAKISSVILYDSANAPLAVWNTTQTRSPTINFELPVEVVSTTERYRIQVVSDGTATLTRPSWLATDKLGTSESDIAAQTNDSKDNGLLFSGNASSVIQTGRTQLNFFTNFSNAGTSRSISISPAGNIQFSNTGSYRFMVYFDTKDAAVYDMGLFRSDTDSRPNPVSYQARSQLNLGTNGPYTIDVLASVTNTSSFFGIDVFTSGPGATTNVSANAYVTIMSTDNPPITRYFYVDSVGTYMIERAELKIGGQSIQTLTGEAIEIYNDLVVPKENQPGLTLLTGKKNTAQAVLDRTYYVNLPFFFYGNSELAVPVCALGRQDMEIYVTFRPFKSLSANAVPFVQTAVTTSLIIEYVYLSDPEVSWMNSHRLDYIITQMQYNTFRLGQGTIVDLDFTGPCREMVVVVQDDSAVPYSYVLDPGLGALLTLNGEDYFDPGTTDFHLMHLITPLEKHTRQPDRTIYVYSFARNPQDPRPSGSINMSRIKQKKFQIILPGTTSLETKEMRVVSTSYNILRVENGLAGLLYQ
jgi:hypothetical protein